MDFNSFFETDAFLACDGETKAMLKQFSEDISGKPQGATLPIFMEYYGRINSEGRLSDATKTALYSAFKSTLNDADLKKLKMMEAFLSR